MASGFVYFPCLCEEWKLYSNVANSLSSLLMNDIETISMSHERLGLCRKLVMEMVMVTSEQLAFTQ